MASCRRRRPECSDLCELSRLPRRRAVKDPQSKVYALNVAETCPHNMRADYMKDINDRRARQIQGERLSKALYEQHDLSAPTCNDCHGNHGGASGHCIGRKTYVATAVRQSGLFQAGPHKAVSTRCRRASAFSATVTTA
jgi:hypothetical protein